MDPDPECAEEGRDRLVVSLTVFVGRVKPLVRIRFFLVRGRVRSWGGWFVDVVGVVGGESEGKAASLGGVVAGPGLVTRLSAVEAEVVLATPSALCCRHKWSRSGRCRVGVGRRRPISCRCRVGVVGVGRGSLSAAGGSIVCRVSRGSLASVGYGVSSQYIGDVGRGAVEGLEVPIVII